MKVIVNADDFGKDENATMAIIDSFGQGYITQTTLMVNMPWCEKAVDLAKEKRVEDKVGLHLTLTEGRPLSTEISKCERFCDKNGNFTRNGVWSKTWVPFTAKESWALEIELRAQIEKFLSFNLPMRHCDGHHHVHILLPVFYVLKKLLYEYDFSSVRKSVDSPWINFFHPRVFAWGMDAIRMLIMPKGIKTVNHFGSIEKILGRVNRFKNDDVVEMMVHPRKNKNGKIVDYKSSDGRLMGDVFDDIKKCMPLLCTYREI